MQRRRKKRRKKRGEKEEEKKRETLARLYLSNPPDRYVASVLVALCVSSPTSLSLLPSRRGESSGERRQAGRPRRRLSASKEAPFGDFALVEREKSERRGGRGWREWTGVERSMLQRKPQNFSSSSHLRISIDSLLGSSSSPKDEPLPIARGGEGRRERERRRRGARKLLLLLKLELAGIDVEATIVVVVACCRRSSGRAPPPPPPQGRVAVERAAGSMLLFAGRLSPSLSVSFSLDFAQEKKR